MAIEDCEIVELYWNRNESAIELTQNKYNSLCASISHNILRNARDVEECLNDLYLAIWNSIPPNKPNSLKLYVCKIIRRISINRAEYETAGKRDRRKTVSFEEIETELSDDFSPNRIPFDNISASDAINQVLSLMPEKHRHILVLRYWFAMPMPEIAKKMCIPLSTIKTILRRELPKLKEYLIQEGVFE